MSNLPNPKITIDKSRFIPWDEEILEILRYIPKIDPMFIAQHPELLGGR